MKWRQGHFGPGGPRIPDGHPSGVQRSGHHCRLCQLPQVCGRSAPRVHCELSSKKRFFVADSLCCPPFFSFKIHLNMHQIEAAFIPCEREEHPLESVKDGFYARKFVISPLEAAAARAGAAAAVVTATVQLHRAVAVRDLSRLLHRPSRLAGPGCGCDGPDRPCPPPFPVVGPIGPTGPTGRRARLALLVPLAPPAPPALPVLVPPGPTGRRVLTGASSCYRLRRVRPVRLARLARPVPRVPPVPAWRR